MVKQKSSDLPVAYPSLTEHHLYCIVRDADDLKPRLMSGLADGYVWTSPEPALEIDKIIDCLITPSKWEAPKGARPPKLRGSNKDLYDLGVACPYEYARIELAKAAKMANAAVDKVIASKTKEADDLDDLMKRARELRRAQLEFIEKSQRSLLYPPYIPWDSPLHRTGKYQAAEEKRQSRMDRAGREFESIKSAIDSSLYIIVRARSSYKNAKGWNPGKVWEKDFVRSMGYTWFKLTRKVPGISSDYFIKFLISGVNTITDLYKSHRITLSWNNAIEETAASVKSGPGWDCFERSSDFRRGSDTIKYVQVNADSKDTPLFLREDQIRQNKKFLEYAIKYKNATDFATKIQAYTDLIGHFSFDPTIEERARELEDIIRTGYFIKPMVVLKPRTVRKRRDD